MNKTKIGAGLWLFILPAVIIAAQEMDRLPALENALGWAIFSVYGAIGVVCLYFPTMAIAKRLRQGKMTSGK